MLWPVSWSLPPLFFSCSFYKRKNPSIYFGKLKPVALLFFPPVTVCKHSPHVRIGDFIYSTGNIILQELEENFSSVSTGFVPRASHQWFKYGCQVNERKCTDLKKTLELLKQRKSTDCSEFRPQTRFAREELRAFYCYAALSKGKRLEWLPCSQSELRETKIGGSIANALWLPWH